MKSWDECLLGEPGPPSQTREEIRDAWLGEYKPSTEWLPGDVIVMDCGMRGFWIKGPGGRSEGKIVEVFPDTVQVLFADGAVQSYIITPSLTVRRVT